MRNSFKHHGGITSRFLRKVFQPTGAENSLAKIESRLPYKGYSTIREAILGVPTVINEMPYIKIASYVEGRDVSDNHNCRNHFRRVPFFPLQHNSFTNDAGSSAPLCGVGTFGSFSFGQAKENEQPSLSMHTLGKVYGSFLGKRSFSCLDTRERTKEKLKARGKIAKNFFTELKQIKRITVLQNTGDEYLFLKLRSEIFLTLFLLKPSLNRVNKLCGVN